MASTGVIDDPPGSFIRNTLLVKRNQSKPTNRKTMRMKPDLRLFKDMELLSQHAAEIFAEQAARSITARQRFLVALNGGGTPTRLFQLLATEYRNKVDWSKVHIFWGDERCVPPNDPGSCYGQAKELLLDHIVIPERHIHRIKGE